jgi:hypothetical protein
VLSSLINVSINSIFSGIGEDRMTGDPLERSITVVALEMFRKPLAKALNRPDRS